MSSTGPTWIQAPGQPSSLLPICGGGTWQPAFIVPKNYCHSLIHSSHLTSSINLLEADEKSAPSVPQISCWNSLRHCLNPSELLAEEKRRLMFAAEGSSCPSTKKFLYEPRQRFSMACLAVLTSEHFQAIRFTH